jgi:hypothetical protein
MPISNQEVINAVLNKARKDKFILVLDVPPILKDIQVNDPSGRDNAQVNLDKLQFSIFSAPVPPADIPAVPMSIYGQTYNVTSQTRTAYPPILINFTIDNQFDNYWVLWKWLETLNKPRESGMLEDFAIFQKGEETKTSLDNARAQLSNILGGFKNKPGNSFASRNRQALSVPSIRRETPKPNSIIKRDVPDVSKLTTDPINRDTATNSEPVDTQPIHMVNDYTDYQTTITIFGLDEYNKKIVRFDYFNAFITNLGEISFNYRVPDEAESGFQFVFNQMEITLLDFL